MMGYVGAVHAQEIPKHDLEGAAEQRLESTLALQSAERAPAVDGASSYDLVKVANDLAYEITKRCLEAGIGEVSANAVSEFIVGVAKSLPPQAAKLLTLNPRGVVGWSARITRNELANGFAKVDPLGFALGVASESLVEFLREELPKSTTTQNLRIELLVFSIRETTIAYAWTRGGIHAAIAAQSIVSGKTLFEALQAGYEVAEERFTRPQREEEQEIADEFLMLREAFKAETDPTLKRQQLSQLNAFLFGKGQRILKGFPDANSRRITYVCNLAKAGNVEWQCSSASVWGKPVSENPFARNQAWRGSYVCAQGETALTLRILNASPSVVSTNLGNGYKVEATAVRLNEGSNR